jgi:hypothetical protein
VTRSLVDSSVLLDLFTKDPVWFEWSVRALDEAGRAGPVFIDPIVYAEVSVGFSRIETLAETLDALPLTWREIPRAALFLAGKAFIAYRRSGGVKSRPLPDFYIGAHAAVEDLTLITRDPERVKTHFPRVRLSTP